MSDETQPKKQKPLSNEERNRWRQTIRANPDSFVKASDEAKADSAVCLEAVQKDGLLLEHCSAQLRANRSLVLEAVKENGEAMHFTDENMRADLEIVQTMLALASDMPRPQLVRLASEELRGKPDIMLDVIHGFWFTAEYVADSLRYEPDFWREVIAGDAETGWMAFSYAPVEMRSDPDLMMQAIRMDPMAFKFASDELRNDSKFVLEAVKVNWIAIKHASSKVRANAKVVLEAVSQDFEALQYASPELLADPAFALEAAGYHGRALARGGVDRSLQDNKDWVYNAVQKNPIALTYTDEDHRSDRNVVNKSMAGTLGACSGLLWKIDDSSMKWAAGIEKLAQEQVLVEKAKEKVKEAEKFEKVLDAFGDDDEEPKANAADPFFNPQDAPKPKNNRGRRVH